jgi:hypothetical protein
MEGTLKDIERRMITEIIIKHPNWNLDSFGFWISPIFFLFTAALPLEQRLQFPLLPERNEKPPKQRDPFRVRFDMVKLQQKRYY